MDSAPVPTTQLAYEAAGQVDDKTLAEEADLKSMTKDEGDKFIDDKDSVLSTSTTLSHLLDIEVDPKLLLSNITSLLATVESTVTGVASLREKDQTDTSENEIAKRLSATCHELYKVLCSLEQVVASYVASWQPGVNEDEISLDPALYKWAADCMLCLLGLQADVEHKLKGKRQDDAIDDTAELQRYHGELALFVQRMEELLPVINADLDSYQTSALRFPGASSPRDQSPDPRAGDRIFLLRNSLYGLKDTLMTIKSAMSSWMTAKMEPDIEAHLACLENDISAAIPTLSTYLTNTGSNWLDSLLAGGLSFSQFRALDPSTFYVLSDRLRTLKANVDSDLAASKYQRDADGRVFTVDPNFDGTPLDSIIDVLCMIEDLNTTLKVKADVRSGGNQN